MAKPQDIFPVLLVGLLVFYPLLALGDEVIITCEGHPTVARLSLEDIGANHSDASKRYYDLAVFSVFKNEADIMEEWLEHHIWQGVQHFFILDNNSTDNIESVIRPYIIAGFVTLCHSDHRPIQNPGLNHLLKLYQDRCTWIASIDLDEFIVSTVTGLTVKDVLTSRFTPNASISQIYMSWHSFGSSGFKPQPDCVRSSFTMRQEFLGWPRDPDPKYIIRGKCATWLSIHEAKFHNCAHPENRILGDRRINVDMGDVYNPPGLRLNHYRIMSEERFQRVKMGRGDANEPHTDKMRDNMGYFHDNDFKDLNDTTLKDMLGPYGCYPMRQKNVDKVY